MDATPIFDFMKWLVLIPLCGLVLVFTFTIAISLGEVVFTILTRLKWRLIDYLDRKFLRGDDRAED